MQAKFKVPRELETGVYRNGVGLHKPGAVFTLPDKATPIDEDGEYVTEGMRAPHWSLIPLNEDADELLQKTYANHPRKAQLKRFGAQEKGPSPKAEANARKREAEAKRLEKDKQERAGLHMGNLPPQ